jgi:P27 family predicted phage terminase small subunit
MNENENQPAKARLLKMPASQKEPRAEMSNWLRPAAKKYWRDHAPWLEKNGLLDVITAGLFTALCCTWANYLAMGERIRKDGMVLTARNGRPYAHPLWAAYNRELRMLLLLSRDFSLTPKSRRRTE